MRNLSSSKTICGAERDRGNVNQCFQHRKRPKSIPSLWGFSEFLPHHHYSLSFILITNIFKGVNISHRLLDFHSIVLRSFLEDFLLFIALKVMRTSVWSSWLGRSFPLYICVVIPLKHHLCHLPAQQAGCKCTGSLPMVMGYRRSPLVSVTSP